MSALTAAPRRMLRLVRADVLNVARDPMLLLATGMSLAPALILALARPAMDEAAQAAFGIVRISHYFLPVALLVPATLIGWVTGFLLLEERDEGTLLAVDVTPLGKSGLLAYRAAIAALLAFAVTLYAWPLVMAEAPPPFVLLMAVLVGLNAVSFAAVLPLIARNKVEGLAVTKLTNLFAVAPLLAAIPSPFRYIAGIIPSYWIGELLGLTSVAPLAPWLAASIAPALSIAVVLALFAGVARKAG
jgi:hypothetical protein